MFPFRKTRDLGFRGEDLAVKYLRRKGYACLARNYRFRRAEIDLICCDDERKLLVFTEVKTRISRDFAEAEDAVTELKQNQILKAAEGFIFQNEKYQDYEKRFDVISVYIDGKTQEIKHLEDVF
jgi:putative endonuclease